MKVWINTKRGFVLKEIKNVGNYHIVGKEGRYKVAIKRRQIKKVKRKRGLVGRRILQSKVKPRYPKLAKGRGRPMKIESTVKRGKVASMTVKDILKENESQINKHYKKLFRNIVLDKGLTNLLSRQENIQKIRWRFEIRGTIFDMNNEKLATINKGSGGDLMEVKKLTKSGIFKGANIQGTAIEGLKNMERGYSFNFIKRGNVDRVEVKLIFRT